MTVREVPYDVEIRRERDGLVRRVSNPAWTWNEASVYYWTEGNMSCDVNLAIAFGDDEDATSRDGDAYTPLRAILATGRVVDFEASYARRNPPPVKTYNLKQMRERIVGQIDAHAASLLGASEFFAMTGVHAAFTEDRTMYRFAGSPPALLDWLRRRRR